MIAHSEPFSHVLAAAAGLLAVGGYALAWMGRPTRRWSRLVAWSVGVAIVLVATSPPVERLAVATFTGHMVQHLGLIILAPPLLVTARPVSLIRHSFRSHGTAAERRLAATWRQWSAIVVPVGFVTVLFGTHLTSLYDLALTNRLLHDAEHLAYLGVAIGLWALVLAPVSARAPGRVAAAFAVIAGTAVLGVVLTSADRPLIDGYVTLLGPAEALRDQRQAAALMWVGGMGLGLPLLMAAVWRWAANEERVARSVEALRDARDAPAGRTPDAHRGSVAIDMPCPPRGAPVSSAGPGSSVGGRHRRDGCSRR